MNGFLHQLKRFWQAEEVPRWFGISVIVIYLGGLGGVAQMGINYATEDRAQTYQRSSEHAVSLLAERLGSVDPADTATLQRVIRKFATQTTVLALRVLDDQRSVAASIDASEIGSRSPVAAIGSLKPRRLEVVDLTDNDFGGPVRVLRAPIPCGTGFQPVADTGSKPVPHSGRPLYLEVVAGFDVSGPADLAQHAGTLTIILCACGALFVVYRRLRRQMLSVARIAQQLGSHGPHIEEELGALRVADSAGVLARQWNQLIDMAETLQTEVRRTKATGELSQVLALASGGTLAEALNAAPNGVLHINDAGQIEYANAASRRLLGLSPKPDCARPCDETIDGMKPDESVAGLVEVIQSARRDDETFEPRNEVREVGADDSSYRIRVLPLRGQTTSGGCLVMIDDVSQQVRADRAREDFVSQVTHELRTPLTNIRAYAETLSSGMFDDPKVVTECYNVITKETRRLSRLIEDILNVSQMEVGTIQLQIDTVDLGALLTESVRDVRGLAEEKNIDLRLALPAKLENIRADRDKLAVVINNLLGNALKYTPAEGCVVVGCKIGASEAMITVKDNGIGISLEDQRRVFEKFQRAEDPDVQNQTGTGVGLYTAREIVRRHGGEIELMSEKGSGSTFIVKLPHVQSRAGALSATPTSCR